MLSLLCYFQIITALSTEKVWLKDQLANTSEELRQRNEDMDGHSHNITFNSFA